VLDRSHRLTASALFSTATRRGRRAGTPSLVLHLLTTPHQATPRGRGVDPAEALVGFVVSKAVGNAVTRNRVKRRLRHLVRARLASLPPHSVLVVRALPTAAEASYARLGTDLEAALHRLLSRRGALPASRT
jgi:ribonuclease P protein component